MHVVATAGHVDHGKSTLVKALTGSDPDRLDEERRRGLTIELGYCWTELAPLGQVAFVDVPGHERFVTTMLAGVGPVPAALFVVAADDPWMPQAAEHLAALDALGVAHGVVAVSRSDLADPGPATLRARQELSRTTLAGAAVVAVSGRTGEGLEDLRRALVSMLGALPDPDPEADVRLWVDRRFSVRGAGTVVTGTLPAGTVRRGDLLEHEGRPVRVRALESLGAPADTVRGPARVALNLAGDLPGLRRGDPLLTPGAWRATSVLDVRLRGVDQARPPERPQLHVGATDVAAHVRPLEDDLVRLTLDRALPLRIGDRALLRDPGSRHIWGVQVLDPAPPPLRRRGAALRRAAELADHDGLPSLEGELARRGLVEADLLRRLGVDLPRSREDGARLPSGAVAAGGWIVSAALAESTTTRAETLVHDHLAADPLSNGLPLAALADLLGLPSPELVAALLRPPARIVDGRVTTRTTAVVPQEVVDAVRRLRADLDGRPYAAPTAERLRELGLDPRTVAVAAREGLVLRLAPGIVLLPDAADTAAHALAALPQPFTASDARQALGTSRRVALPLLDHLDRTGRTRRLPDDRREVRTPPGRAPTGLDSLAERTDQGSR